MSATGTVRAQTAAPPPAAAAPAVVAPAAPAPATPAPEPPTAPAASTSPPPLAAPGANAGPAKAATAVPTTTFIQPKTRPQSQAAVEQHIARLHAALKITPAQQANWDAFAQVMRDNAAHMDSITKAHPEHATNASAVEGLKSYEAITQAHLEDLQRLEPAFETLYNAMSDSQKKMADNMFRRPAAPPRPARAAAPTSTE